MTRTMHRLAISIVLLGFCASAVLATAQWSSPDRYRVLMNVNTMGVTRRNSPAAVDIDFQQLVSSTGSGGVFDPDTIEVVAYSASGVPKVFDATRTGYEQWLLPWRIQPYYGIDRVTLSFVIPDNSCNEFAVYFDTVGSGNSKPQRYRGLVGDGDWFTEGYSRREINACGYDTWCDFDGDGDLDIFKGGTEPFIYCYENVGENRYIDKGRLTSGGDLLTLPHDALNRAWISVEFYDWDRDGDQDLFVHTVAGPGGGDNNQVSCYENITPPGGPVTFRFVKYLYTVEGRMPGSTLAFVDWDGDGKTDVLSGAESLIAFMRNISPDNSIANMTLADGQYIRANGTEIQVMSPRVSCADIDNDGDLDMFVGTEDGQVYWFTNVGTRTSPAFTEGRMIAFYEFMDLRSGVKVHDFDGDGLLDFAVGRFWERTQWGEQPRVYGRLYKNIGTPTNPKFEARDAYGGAPYTEQYQNCDAIRQNGVRACDWNSDGRIDLIAGDTDGFVWFFRNITNQLFPIFAPGVRLYANGEPLRVYGEWNECRQAGYARCDIADWNNDGRKDLLVADGRGWLWLYLNQGTDANPVLAAGTRVWANGKPIDGTSRSSVLVCDWDNDGKKDVILGMAGEGENSVYYDWPHQGSDPSFDRGFLFYKNTGTDASPVLAYPKWVTAGSGTVINYTRPNLGDYLDWDGDGKKDFIGCEFEHNARFYKNMSTGGIGVEPSFTTSYDGTKIVAPWTVQMMSGADAVDFNADGDIDIITGQGHGGSGLRFYERDYINDFVNNTYPIVALGAGQKSLSIREAKDLDNGEPVIMVNAVVTAVFDGFFYVQAAQGLAGIRVVQIGYNCAEGDIVDVYGTIYVNESRERYIEATNVVSKGR